MILLGVIYAIWKFKIEVRGHNKPKNILGASQLIISDLNVMIQWLFLVLINVRSRISMFRNITGVPRRKMIPDFSKHRKL